MPGLCVEGRMAAFSGFLMQWCAFHGSKYDLQGHVLHFVQPALVGLGSHSQNVVDAYSMVGRTIAV